MRKGSIYISPLYTHLPPIIYTPGGGERMSLLLYIAPYEREHPYYYIYALYSHTLFYIASYVHSLPLSYPYNIYASDLCCCDCCCSPWGLVEYVD